MNLQDAIYNWLSIKVVAEARPDDLAATDTFRFFDDILKEDHQIETIKVMVNGPWYYVTFKSQGSEETKQYPIELVDALLESINTEPKYNQ